MTENVPDEILELILYLALVIPSETFESWGSSTSFAGTPRSTVPHLLLVSKRWHYLGKPALYESAILRTKRQVNALAGAAGKVNGRGIKQGTYLRRLRIEGGYNNRFNQLLAAGPNIHTLFIGFDISLDDSASGLKRGLQRINPSRLYLKATPGGHLTAQNTMSLYAAVAAAFPSWTNLKRIDTSPSFMSAGSIETGLKELSSLEYISTTSFRPFCPDNPSLKTIQIRDGNNWLENWKQYPNQLSRIDREKVVLGEGKNMIRWTDLLQLRADLPEGASKLLDLPDKVWSQILDRVTDIHWNTYPALTVGFFHRPAEVRANTARRNVVLVNKRFHRLGIPYLYTVPYLPSERAVYGFIYRVQSSAVLAAFVREIFVPETLVLSGHSAPISIPMMKNLERVLSFHLPVLLGYAKCLPEGQVSKLEQAHEHHAQAVPFAPRDFLKFPHLRDLSLRGGCGAELDDVHPDVLPQLERLTVINPGPRIFRVFQSMSLPRLRHFTYSTVLESTADDPTDFLKIHGSKIDTICLSGIPHADATYPPVLDLCPNLTELRFDSLDVVDLDKVLPVSAWTGPHLSLRKLVLPAFTLNIPQPGRHEAERTAWNAFVGFLTTQREQLPALEEIRIFKLTWPMHASDYNVSRFSILALDLHELGIALADRDGTRWARFDPIPDWLMRRARATEPLA